MLDTDKKILEILDRYTATTIDTASQKSDSFLNVFSFKEDVPLELVNLAKTEIDEWVSQNYISPQVADRVKDIQPEEKFFEIFDKVQEVIKISKGLSK